MTYDDVDKLKHTKHNTFLHTLYYDVPICIMTFKQYLTAVEYAPTSQNLILFDYSAVIEHGIKNELRPAEIVANFLNRILRLNEPNVLQHDLHELTIEKANDIVALNIAAIADFNNYVNEYVAINQLNNV